MLLATWATWVKHIEDVEISQEKFCLYLHYNKNPASVKQHIFTSQGQPFQSITKLIVERWLFPTY